MKVNKTNTAQQWRQGDVLIERVDSVPASAKLSTKDVFPDRVVLAYGEVTGHSHQIKHGGEIVRHDNADGSFFLTLPAEVEVQHDEHSTQVIPPGVVRITRQREYSPEEIRNVAD